MARCPLRPVCSLFVFLCYKNEPLVSSGQAADTAATRPDLKTFVEMREKLHNALSELELREQDVARLDQRNAHLERELKLQGQHHTNARKEVVMLKRELAQRG